MIIDARTVFDTQRSKRWGCCRVSNPLIRVPRAGDRGGPTRGTTSRIRYARRGVTSVGDRGPGSAILTHGLLLPRSRLPG